MASKAGKLKAKRAGRKKVQDVPREPNGRISRPYNEYRAMNENMTSLDTVKDDEECNGRAWVDQDSMKINKPIEVEDYFLKKFKLKLSMIPDDLEGDGYKDAAAKIVGPLNCVYFLNLGRTSYYKIGCAKDGIKRMSSIQTGNPQNLKMVAWVGFKTIGLNAKAEKYAHELGKRFSRYISREWFEMDSNAISKVIMGLDAKYGDEIYGISYTGYE